MNRVSGKNFEKMMIEASQNNFSFFAWQSFNGIIEKCELKIKTYKKDYNIIEFEIESKDFDNIEKVVSGNRIINIYVPGLSISFNSELKSISADKKLKISIPSEYAFYERRKHERLQPSKTCYVSFEINKVMQRKNIFDISQGGIAIILPKSKRMDLDNSADIFQLTLDILGTKIKVEAQYLGSMVIDAYRTENLPYGGYKIAFRFSKISEKDKDFIKEFINLQSQSQKLLKKAT